MNETLRSLFLFPSFVPCLFPANFTLCSIIPSSLFDAVIKGIVGPRVQDIAAVGRSH